MHSDFLSREFGGRFNDCANRITHLTGIFAVGIVDAPQLLTRFGWESLRYAHGRS